MKKMLVLLLSFVLVLSLTSCSTIQVLLEKPTPTPEPTATPAPTAEPEPEPEDEGYYDYLRDTLLPELDGVPYIRGTSSMEDQTTYGAAPTALYHVENGKFVFDWMGGRIGWGQSSYKGDVNADAGADGATVLVGNAVACTMLAQWDN